MQLEKILLVYGALLKEPTPKGKTLPLGGKKTDKYFEVKISLVRVFILLHIHQHVQILRNGYMN